MWGKGITTNIKTLPEALTAYKFASQYKGSYVIAEEHINGHDHRILILGGKYIAGLKRMPPFIIGDGKNTIEELVTIENEKRKESTAIAKEILLDEAAMDYLNSQSLTLKSIPNINQEVYLRMVGNICSGGISENVTTMVHPSIIELCENIGAYLNMDILGVDVITTDISLSLSETGGKITEINANPDIDMHTAPYIGEAINTSLLFVDYLYPNLEDAWIEITHNDKLIKKQKDLNKYLENIPNKVIQLKNKNSRELTTINLPNKSLYTYLLDARTVSIDI
jgi:cyanophycin synthetase